jgi:hypothetical protein
MEGEMAPWISRSKSLSLAASTPHPLVRPGVVGRAPGVTTITFSPMEFFGAAARCSHMNVISPIAVTPESLIISSLVEQHVDDTSSAFAVLATADNFKDYVKSYFAGTVASGVAYLQMCRDGYAWVDHFETVSPRAPGAPVVRTPDFVFSRPGRADVALMESKGTRGAAAATFDTTVENGYLGQVEPHLGSAVGTAIASHGFCIGGWLTSPIAANLRIHHTAAAGPTSGGRVPPADVQRGNYATALTLAHGERVGRDVRQGNLDLREIFFWEFEWLGRRFVTRWPVPGAATSEACRARDLFWSDAPLPFAFCGFALERDWANAVLRRALDGLARQTAIDLPTMTRDEIAQAREDGGALFPDGFAAVGRKSAIARVRPVIWTGHLADFHDAKI